MSSIIRSRGDLCLRGYLYPAYSHLAGLDTSVPG